MMVGLQTPVRCPLLQLLEGERAVLLLPDTAIPLTCHHGLREKERRGCQRTWWMDFKEEV